MAVTRGRCSSARGSWRSARCRYDFLLTVSRVPRILTGQSCISVVVRGVRVRLSLFFFSLSFSLYLSIFLSIYLSLPFSFPYLFINLLSFFWNYYSSVISRCYFFFSHCLLLHIHHLSHFAFSSVLSLFSLSFSLSPSLSVFSPRLCVSPGYFLLFIGRKTSHPAERQREREKERRRKREEEISFVCCLLLDNLSRTYRPPPPNSPPPPPPPPCVGTPVWASVWIVQLSVIIITVSDAIENARKPTTLTTSVNTDREVTREWATQNRIKSKNANCNNGKFLKFLCLLCVSAKNRCTFSPPPPTPSEVISSLNRTNYVDCFILLYYDYFLWVLFF